MTQVVSFEDYVPPARFDTIAWTHVEIEEAPTSTGTWTLIDTLALSPVDSDPSSPQTRSFTTNNGTGPDLWYRVIFTDASNDTSNPTEAVQNKEPAGNDYITSAQLKSTLEIGTGSYADDDIATAISAASRVIDAYKDTRFYPTGETRRYTADPCERSVQIDDLITLTALKVDMDGDGTYETTWTVDTDFYLEPINAALESRPYNQVTLRPQRGDVWPPYAYAVQVGGTFGWATAPDQVTQATTILAGRYLKRARETPFGILTIGTDAIAAARLGRIDPDVSFLLDNLDADEPLLIL